MTADPVDVISRICDDAEGNKLTRIAAVLGVPDDDGSKPEVSSSNLDLDRLRKIGIDLSDYMGAPNCGRDVVRAADEIQRLQAIEVEARKVVAWLDRTEASGAHYAGLARLVRP